jgi:hypothetical protein
MSDYESHGTEPDNVLLGVTGSTRDNLPEDKRLRLNLTSVALSSEALRLKDFLGQQIMVEYYYSHPVELPANRDQPARKATRVALIDRNGKAYASTSKGVVSSLRVLIDTFGAEPIPEWVCIIPRRSSTTSGFSTLTFDVQEVTS